MQRVGDSSLFFVKNQEPARVEHFRTSDQILFALFYHLFKRVHHFDSCPFDMIYQETVITCDKMYLGISTSKTWDIWGYHPENYLQPTAECPMGLWPLMNQFLFWVISHVRLMPKSRSALLQKRTPMASHVSGGDLMSQRELKILVHYFVEARQRERAEILRMVKIQDLFKKLRNLLKGQKNNFRDYSCHFNTQRQPQPERIPPAALFNLQAEP